MIVSRQIGEPQLRRCAIPVVVPERASGPMSELEVLNQIASDKKTTVAGDRHPIE